MGAFAQLSLIPPPPPPSSASSPLPPPLPLSPGLDYQQAVHKMRLLTLASLASETSQVSFQDLTVQLDLPQERVEALIIEGSAPSFRLVMSYSGTADKGPSEIGMTSLQRTLVSTPC